MSQHLSPDWILLGTITRAHGIRGALSYQLSHADSTSLREGLKIALSPPLKKGGQGGFKFYVITHVLTGDRLRLAGISDRTEAEKLAKTEIWVRRSDFQALAEDEVYLADLLGFTAVNTEGKILGHVTGFSDNKAQHLVQIDHKILVPFVKPILVKIDEENRQIILDYHDES